MSLRGAIQCSEMACRAVVFSNMQDQVICIDENPCCLIKPLSDYGWARLLISGVIRCRMQQLTRTCEWLFFGARLFPVDTSQTSSSWCRPFTWIIQHCWHSGSLSPPVAGSL